MAKNKVTSFENIKGADVLEKKFDNVILENLADYQTLELSNNVNTNGIDKVVYLKLNISYSGNGGKTPKDCLEGAIKGVLPWLELLLHHDEKIQKNTSQLSLFEDDSIDDNELEKEPESPKENDGWDKYWRELYRVRINNLKKKYKFFELFNPLTWWWSYHEFNYEKFIPSDEQMLALVKDSIIKYKNNNGRHDDAWFENVEYITKNGAISDVELYSRVMHCLRIFVCPFKSTSAAFFDDSYTLHREPEEAISHLFYFDGSRLNLNYSEIKNYINRKNEKEFGRLKDEIVSYDFYTPDFISFLRDELEVEEKDPLLDEQVEELALKSFAGSISKNWQSILNNSSSYKDFKSNLFKDVISADISFPHLRLDEDYSCNITLDKRNPMINIEQRTSTRKHLGYVDNENAGSWWKTIVDFIEGDEVYKRIFKKFKEEDKTPRIVQTSLFDFLEVA